MRSEVEFDAHHLAKPEAHPLEPTALDNRPTVFAEDLAKQLVEP